MKSYDVVVIGSGSGLRIVQYALEQGKSVALLDKGPLGGTCLNLGCIPSKMLLYPADLVRTIEHAKELGVSAKITNINAKKILNYMQTTVKKSQHKIIGKLKKSKADVYKGTAKFLDAHTLEINGKKVRGKKVFVLSGTRPFVPPIKGIDKAPYYTSDTIFAIKKLPKSIVIVGGGYIGIEFCHFFASMGVKVTVLQRDKVIVPSEDKDICDALLKELSKHANIVTRADVLSVSKSSKGISVKAKRRGKPVTFTAQALMIATGRRSNADLLKVNNAGIKTDKRGFIKTNPYLQTSVKHIYCAGDANAKAPFKHAANYEADLAWSNAMGKKKRKARYDTIPHAIFTYPQVAGIGLTEEQARSESKNVSVIKNPYTACAKGMAMKENRGFAKAVYVNNKLAGFHIIGPHASILIQEVINKMAKKDAMVIHPSLSELVERTLV